MRLRILSAVLVCWAVVSHQALAQCTTSNSIAATPAGSTSVNIGCSNDVNNHAITHMAIDQTSDGTTNAVHLVPGTNTVGKVDLLGNSGATLDTTPGGTAATNAIQIQGVASMTPVMDNIAPTAAAAAGIVPVMSSAVEASHVMKASPGNLYGFMVQNGATAGCVMVFNATSAPADGTVAPAMAPIEMAANTTAAVQFANGSPPAYLSTGITLAYSSTCGLTKTASATALFSAMVK